MRVGMADLFADDPPAGTATSEPSDDAPLAERLRPRGLEDVVGQEHLTGPDGALGRMIAAGKLSSLILWGPPGTGKTSIARLLADAVGAGTAEEDSELRHSPLNFSYFRGVPQGGVVFVAPVDSRPWAHSSPASSPTLSWAFPREPISVCRPPTSRSSSPSMHRSS